MSCYEFILDVYPLVLGTLTVLLAITKYNSRLKQRKADRELENVKLRIEIIHKMIDDVNNPLLNKEGKTKKELSEQLSKTYTNALSYVLEM